MKKVVSLLSLLLVIALLSPALLHAAASPSLYLNGGRIGASSEPRVVNNFTMVPLRVIAEEIGFNVHWSAETRSIHVRSGDSHLILTLDQATARVDGENKTLDAPPFADQGVTYVPLRFVGEHLGLTVYWDQKTRSVFMYEKRKSDKPGSGGKDKEEDGGKDGIPGSGDEAGNERDDGESILDPAPLPPVPADAQAVVQAVEFDGASRVTVRYEGDVTPNEPHWSGTKLVIDLPYASLSPKAMAELAARKQSQLELIIDILALERVRYSYYDNNPSTVRLVFDLKMRQDYRVTLEEGALHVDFVLTELPAPAESAYKVVIDAGHGGKDPGAPSVTGRWEKEFNLAVALKLYKLLEQESGIDPYLTRSEDVFIELYDRSGYANDLGADLFVSIHANRFTTPVSGVETYYNRAESFRLAEVLHERLVAATGLADRGVRKASFVVIRETNMPAVLLECGYLSNSHDAALLFTEAVQDRIAAELAAGIKEYLTAYGGK